MLTKEDVLMGRDVAYPGDYNAQIEQNVISLVNAVNGFMKDIGWEGTLSVTSGWRPPSVNANTLGAAKKSYHMRGLACDFKRDEELLKLVIAHPEIMRKWGLWLEDSNTTKTWIHLDLGTRMDRPSRVFIA